MNRARGPDTDGGSREAEFEVNEDYREAGGPTQGVSPYEGPHACHM